VLWAIKRILEMSMCKERIELQKQLDAAALGFSTALDRESLGPTQEGPEMKRLHQLVLQAEQAWESAQTAFLRHVKEHRCQGAASRGQAAK
jgi:hypothetical protein